MAMTLGGRAAEEIVFGEITTGASNDLEKVTATAKQMVMRFGMSEKLGPRVFGHDHGQPFLGREFSSEPDYSDEIAREIDDEIRRIVESAHQVAKDILARAPRGADDDLRAPAQARDDRERGVRGAARRQDRGGGLRPRRRRPTPARPSGPSCRARPTARRASCGAPAPRPRRRRRRGARARAAREARAGVARVAGRGARRGYRDHGRRQRHAGLVLRRRRASSTRAAAIAHGLRARRPRAPTSSTSAASRRGPGAEPVAERRGAAPRRAGRSRGSRARRRRADLDRHVEGSRSPRAALDGGRDLRQRRDRASAATPRWRRSSPSAASTAA